jgi:arsenate reductase
MPFHWKNEMTDQTRVLILCTGNSARSQMAEGLLRHDAGDTFIVESAGLEPTFVRPEAIKAMQEIGIDISDQRSKSLDKFMGQPFEYVITVCDNANQNCPIFPGAKHRIHWSVEDPATVRGTEETRLKAFRAARDDLRARLGKFIEGARESSR